MCCNDNPWLAGSPSTQKHKIKKASALKTVEQKPGMYTKYKPHLQADKVSGGASAS